MKLNRERVVAALSLFILLGGLYGIFESRRSFSTTLIPTDLPASAQSTPQIEPRLYLEQAVHDRTPFLVSTDWMPVTPEELPAPAPERSRWIVVPLEKGSSPADVGLLFLREPPREPKSDAAAGSGGGASGSNEGAAPAAGGKQ